MNSPYKTGRGFSEKAKGAFLAAAVGDALGWPNEDRSSRVGRRDSSVVKSFQRWVRRPGGRFLPHEDVILPGEYSDDTQLLLCTARSLLYGDSWWKQFATREFPLWRLYERGAGGASKRAADEWLGGKEPWSDELRNEDRRRYFNAGGNGVAMRIMPHVLLGAHSSDFQDVARNIVANGIISHGHPRALVGALAYGYALWRSFQQVGTLEYGDLINLTLEGQKSWGSLPVIDDICPTWLEVAHKTFANGYESAWRSTVDEVLSSLETSRKAIKQGALAIDHEALERIGCFDPKVNGAGTVTAAAVIFLTSRYAADPVHGILEAAFAPGADTDTLASMTGALLGAVRGREWLGEYSEQVQDSEYFSAIAEQIAQAGKVSSQQERTQIVGIKKVDLDAVISKLMKSHEGDTIILPDSREAKILGSQKHTSGSTLDVISWKLTTGDGQTLYVKRITRKPRQRELAPTDRARVTSPSPQGSIQLVRSWVKLPVTNFEKSRLFYRDVIGLKVQLESASKVRFEQAIELIPQTYAHDLFGTMGNSEKSPPKWRAIVLLETRTLESAYQRIKEFGAKIQTPMTEKSGRRFFRCLDPDENILELLESR